jgi:hypothetical protein
VTRRITRKAEYRTEFLSIIYMNFRLQSVKAPVPSPGIVKG